MQTNMTVFLLSGTVLNVFVINQPDHSSIKLVRVPSHSELKKALEVYGFQLDSSSKSSSDVEMVPAG